MPDLILRQDTAGLCTLTLNRPGKLNALDTAMFEELESHIVALERETDRIGCVVLRANGRAFCAGADLDAMGKTAVPPTYKPRIIERLGLLPQPVVAAVHGICYTGGLELILAADFIVADSTAQFADTHGKWGLVGAWGMTQRLPRRIGIPAAKRMMMTAAPVSADEAKRLGLIDLIAPQGGLDRLVEGFTLELLANSWHTNFGTKRLLRETDGMSLSAGIAHEHDHHPGHSADHRERLDKFGRK